MNHHDPVSPVVYQCLFCGESISPGTLDPCGLTLVTGFDRPRQKQREQIFYCHIACIQARASTKPDCFYITDPEFPTIGEIEEEP